MVGSTKGIQNCDGRKELIDYIMAVMMVENIMLVTTELKMDADKSLDFLNLLSKGYFTTINLYKVAKKRNNGDRILKLRDIKNAMKQNGLDFQFILWGKYWSSISISSKYKLYFKSVKLVAIIILLNVKVLFFAQNLCIVRHEKFENRIIIEIKIATTFIYLFENNLWRDAYHGFLVTHFEWCGNKQHT